MRIEYLNTLLSLIIVYLTSMVHTKMYCSHLFKPEHRLFSITPPENDRFTSNISLLENGKKLGTAQVLISACHEVEIPDRCRSIFKKARLVYQKDNGDCVIVSTDSDSKYSYLEATEDQRAMILLEHKDDKDLLVRFKFICEPNQHELEFKSDYDLSTNTFEFISESKYGCGYSLDFYRYATKSNKAIGMLFGVSGILFCYLGFYIYKNIFLMVVLYVDYAAAIFVYLDYVELEQFGYRKYIILTVYTVIAYATYPLLYKYRMLLYILLVTVVSYETVIMFFCFIHQYFQIIDVFYDPLIYTAILMLFTFLTSPSFWNSLIVILTSGFGAFLIVLSCIYFEMINFDILYDYQMRTYSPMTKPNKEHLKLLVVYFASIVTGNLAQGWFVTPVKYTPNEDTKI